MKKIEKCTGQFCSKLRAIWQSYFLRPSLPGILFKVYQYGSHLISTLRGESKTVVRFCLRKNLKKLYWFKSISCLVHSQLSRINEFGRFASANSFILSSLLIQKLFEWLHCLLVACTRLYKTLFWSVGWSIGRCHLIFDRVFCCFEACRDSLLPLPNRTRLR